MEDNAASSEVVRGEFGFGGVDEERLVAMADRDEFGLGDEEPLSAADCGRSPASASGVRARP